MNHFTPQTLSVAPPARGRLRKRLLWIGLTLLLLLLACIGAGFYLDRLHERELREAEAEADRLDPGWRLQDLESSRAPVPDAENSAPKLLAAAALVPARWPTSPAPAPDPGLEDRVLQLGPQTRPDKKLLDEVRAALKQVGPAVERARQLAAYPRGRHAIAWDFAVPLNHVDAIRRVKLLLYLDTLVQAEDRDTKSAAQSCLAIVNSGRSLAGEPTLMSQIFRAHCQHFAERAIERLLAQSEPPEAILKTLQTELANEAVQPLMLLAFRSYRALTHEDLILLKEGQVNRGSLRIMNPYGLPDRAININDALRARACHPAYLRYLTQLVEIAKLPPEQQGPRLEKLTLPQMVKPTLSFFLEVPDKEIRQIHRIFLATLARLRCAVAGLAVERYRVDTGEWPQSLANLVPQYLREVPFDPFDGAALRYRRLADGVVIYGVGPDRKDHGGRLTREMPPPEGADLGFQLWDPSKRGQAAARE